LAQGVEMGEEDMKLTDGGAYLLLIGFGVVFIYESLKWLVKRFWKV
jgi:Na+-transporting methylmalonyl-CoA/oxaloacetate decarboxylase gamma subunit